MDNLSIPYPKYWINRLDLNTTRYAHNQVPHEIISYLQKIIDDTTDPNEIGLGRDVVDRFGVDAEKFTHTGFKIIKATRIENPSLWADYFNERRKITPPVKNPIIFKIGSKGDLMHTEFDLEDQLNEGYLFHGCPRDAADNIQDVGWNEKYSPFTPGTFFSLHFN